MPELIEVERYRRAAAEILEVPVLEVDVVDRRMLRGAIAPEALTAALVGRSFRAARRRGKLLVLDTDAPGGAGPSLGLRFGMTGGLIVGGTPVIDRLRHSSATVGEQWVRFRMSFGDGRTLELHDPRRFASVWLDPDESVLGPDATEITLAGLRSALAGRGLPGPALKARLMDQSRLAGLGNLLADEILWRAALAPARPASGLSPTELRRLHRQLHATLDRLTEAGGSHLGELVPERHPGGRCPKDGAELSTGVVGGRTTWWCPRHQV